MQKLFVGPFYTMIADVCHGGGRRRQTGAMVYRISIIQQAPSEDCAAGARAAEDGQIRESCLLGTLSLCSDGPGEPSGGSVRPRGRSLRPDGVRTWIRAGNDARDVQMTRRVGRVGLL